MFSVNKLLQKQLQRSDNLEFKVKFATQISLNFPLGEVHLNRDLQLP